MPSLLIRESPSSNLFKVQCTFVSSTDFERLAKKALFKGLPWNVEIFRTYKPSRSNTQKKADIPEPPGTCTLLVDKVTSTSRLWFLEKWYSN